MSDLRHQIHKYEDTVFEFIQSIYPYELSRNRTDIIPPYELDFYFPTSNVAIEYDSLCYHSDKKHGKEYHVNKTILCLARKIRLIHIFESEWRYKEQIVKSHLMNILKRCPVKIDAETECTVQEISKSQTMAFQKRTHLLGYIPCTLSIGLFHDDELVATMSFLKTTKDRYKLIRFCTKLNTHIRNAQNVLIEYFETHYHPKSIITMLDRRWDDGRKLQSIGFRIIKFTGPRALFFDKSSHLYNKYGAIKRIKTDEDNPSKVSDETLVRQHKFGKIYDCGYIVLEKKCDK